MGSPVESPAAISAEVCAETGSETPTEALNLHGRLLRNTGHGQGIMPLQLTRLCSGLSVSEAKSMRTLVFSTAVKANRKGESRTDRVEGFLLERIH
jgi:hypothetical protein